MKERAKVKLEGERLAWFELAFHLHKTVEELREAITYSEFLEWQEFFRLEALKNLKADWYLAQIAAEVRRGIVKDPEKVRVKDFILRYATPEEASESRTEDLKTHRTMLSKSAWLSAINKTPNNVKAN